MHPVAAPTPAILAAACCAHSDLLSRMCGDRATCGVLLVVIAVISVVLISLCAMGGFCYR